MRQVIVVLLLMIPLQIYAQSSEERSRHFNLIDGLALQGFDPVSYFSNNPQKGNSKYSVQQEGVTYYFISEANKEEFQKNATKYEPQYGGWCAYALGKSGDKVEINPKTYKIIEGKLYLFYNAYLNNTLKDWNKDELHLKKQADLNWDKTFKK